ncbi:hypothetical protein ACC684_28420 [Rhizobium ruizarguesonis]
MNAFNQYLPSDPMLYYVVIVIIAIAAVIILPRLMLWVLGSLFMMAIFFFGIFALMAAPFAGIAYLAYRYRDRKASLPAALAALIVFGWIAAFTVHAFTKTGEGSASQAEATELWQ